VIEPDPQGYSCPRREPAERVVIEPDPQGYSCPRPLDPEQLAANERQRIESARQSPAYLYREWERELAALKQDQDWREFLKAEKRIERILAGEFIPEPRPGTWEGHFMWCLTAFGDKEFTTHAVRDAATAGGWIAPPGYVVRDGHWREGTTTARFDPAAPRFVLRLGQAYASVAGEFSRPPSGILTSKWIWITAGRTGHANIRRWQVSAKIAYPVPEW
jgi:hypothetical protein